MNVMKEIWIRDNDNVQPGWIYVSKDKTFHPPKNIIPLNIGSRKWFEAEAVSSKELKAYKNSNDILWKEIIKPLNKNETCSLVKCTVNIEKYIMDPEKGDLNYQCAFKVIYSSTLFIILKYNKSYIALIPKRILNDLIRIWRGQEVNKNGSNDKFYSKINSATIYCDKKQTFKSDFQNAFLNVISKLKTCNDTNRMVSTKATVNKISYIKINSSEDWCNTKSLTRKCQEKPTLWKKILKRLNGFCKLCKFERKIRKTQDKNDLNIPATITPLGSFLSDIDCGHHTCNPFETVKFVSNVKPEVFSKQGEIAFGKIATECENINRGTDNEYADSVEYCGKELHEPLLWISENNYEHKYFYNSSDITAKGDFKTLVLFGSEGCGQLSLLNLLWRSTMDHQERIKAKPIIDISATVDNITFYHFKVFNFEFMELIIITTPPLTHSSSLGTLQELLTDREDFNFHALGFVVNSRSETLTPEERSLFNFIRSSFGEVSNHHLMIFLTFCDCSGNFPVLEEMNFFSIKSTCNVELTNGEEDPRNELHGIEASFLKQDLKNVHLMLDTLKDLPRLFFKATKISQKIYFLKSHEIALLERLKDKLKQLTSLQNRFEEDLKSESSNDVMNCNFNSRKDDMEEIIQSVWMLAKVIYAMKESQCSEGGLLEFVYKLIKLLVDLTKWHQKCFVIIVFGCKDRNITTSFSVALDLYYDFLSALCPDLESTEKAVSLSKKVLNYLKTIPGSNDLNDKKESKVQYKNELTQCPYNSHDISSNLQDFIGYFYSSSKFVLNNLQTILKELPKALDEGLLHATLSEMFPKFKQILEFDGKNNILSQFLVKTNSEEINV